MNMISTGSFQTEANASTKQEELMKVLTAAWEKKNSKAARTGGVSLMALSLAACGGSSEDTTPFDQAHVDAEKALSYDAGYDAGTDEAVELVTGLTTSNNTLTAANAELTTANAELTTANAELTTTNAELTTTNANLTTANADLTTDIQTANATITTINDTAHATEQAAYNAGETAGAASRDDEVNTLTADLATANSDLATANTTITTIDNTAHASEQDAYDAGVASLQATVDAYNALVAQNALDAARTLDADGGAITLSTSGTIIVSGTTAGADTLNATVDAGGNATVIFDFSDAEDTVVLTSADLTGVTAIEVQDGTVDFTAVGSMDGIALTLGSGAVLTAAQATGLASIGAREGAASYDLTVNVAAGDDVDALTAALTAAGAGGNVTVAADDGVLSPAQSAALGAVATVENASGGAVVTTNAAPVLETAAETTAIDSSAQGVTLTATATVSDAEGNWNGGSITISVEDGYLIGDDTNDSDGLTIAGGLVASATVPYQYSLVSGSIIAEDAAGAQMIVGTVTNNGAATTAGDVTHTSLTITLNENATTAIVNDLLVEMQFDGVVANGIEEEADVTVTISDADGASTSFTRLADSDGASALAIGDDREVLLADISGAAGIEIENGDNATLTNAGLDLDGATLTITSDVAGDNIDVTAGGLTIVSGQLSDGALIGTVTGNDTNSVTITFNSTADAANIATLIRDTTITGSQLGEHNVVTTITEASGDTSVTDTTTLTVVGDFVAGTANGLANGGATAGAPMALADLTAATANAPVVLGGNTYLEIAGAEGATDIDALIAAGAIDASAASVVRVIASTAGDDITAVSGLSSLADSVVLHTVAGANAVTMTTAQAVAFGTVAVDGTIAISDLETNLAADLSGITATAGFTADIATGGEAMTFTGNMGSASVAVNGGGVVTVTAAIADGATTSAGTVAISDAASLDGVDLSNLNAVNVTFDADTTLSDAATNLGGATITVDENTTLTVTGAIATGKTIGATNATTYADTGSSVVVTDLGAAHDLSGISAGTNGGQVGASAGTLTTAISEDLTFTGDLGDFTATVAADATLTGAAATLTGEAIGGAGAVVVTALNATAAADLSTITVTGGLSANVASDVTFTGDLNGASVTVAEDATLTTTAAKATGLTIAGSDTSTGGAQTGGSMIITALGTDAVDLSGISAGSATEVADTDGTVTVQVGGNVTIAATTDLGDAILDTNDNDVVITAAQANGRTIDDSSGNADSITIDVTSAGGTENLGGITANVAAATLTSFATVDLSNMTLDAQISSIVVDDADADTVDATTVTMTVAQADAMNTAGSAAVATIANAANNADADGVAQADDTISLVVTADADNVAGATYIGSAGDDNLGGTGGADDITGGNGDDVINGGAGNDSNLDGGAGDDQINGGDGTDTILGGDGADTIDGGAGIDNITGGDGVDTVTTGDGDDIIIYAANTNSGIGTGSRDIVLDFTDAGIAGGDVIDLSYLDGDGGALTTDMTFLGTGAFTGAAAAEVRYTVISGNAIVEVDATGDGAANFQIQLNNVDTLGAVDFDFIA